MKRVLVGLGVSAALFLAGCESQEEYAVKRAKSNLDIVHTYNLDTTLVVVEEEKSISQLAEELMLENVGLSTGVKKFAEAGILEGQGLFVETAIREGGDIPKTSAISQESLQLLDTGGDAFEELKKQAFERLQKNRQKVLAQQKDSGMSEQKKLEAELQKRVDEQKKRIAEQQQMVGGSGE